MCGRILSRLDFKGIRKITQAWGSRRAGQNRRGYNIGPRSFLSNLVQTDSLPPQNQDSKLPQRSSPKTRNKTFTEQSKSSKIQEESLKFKQDFGRPNRTLTVFAWGLTNFYKKNRKKPLVINIRLQTLHQKFRKISHKRCIIQIDGYYQWVEHQPYVVFPKKGLFFLAGLFDGDQFAIITIPASETMFWLHERMPAFICKQDFDMWLDSTTPLMEALSLIQGKEADQLQYYSVPTLVNYLSNDGPELIMKLEDYKQKQKSEGIMKYYVAKRPRVEEDQDLLPSKLRKPPN